MEILIVIVILAILVTFAVAQFGRSRVTFQRQNIAREFKVNLERGRFDSVKRNASDTTVMARVVINNPTSFSVTTDLNQNNVLDASDTRTVNFSNNSNVKIVLEDGIFPVTITFDHRGQITSLDSSTPKKSVTRFIFCTDNCTAATATKTNANIITVSPTGTVAMLAGGETQPNFTSPSVTGGGYQINPDLLIQVNSVDPIISPTPAPSVSQTPTPTPTPTPISTPTPTPTATPSPTATPLPTATPTPLPNACAYGQRPRDTGCVCQAPRWVRGNGKCQ